MLLPACYRHIARAHPPIHFYVAGYVRVALLGAGVSAAGSLRQPGSSTEFSRARARDSRPGRPGDPMEAGAIAGRGSAARLLEDLRLPALVLGSVASALLAGRHTISPGGRHPLPQLTAAWRVQGCSSRAAGRVQTGWSRDLASAVNSFGPPSVMCQQSSSRTPNSPGT